MDTAKNYDKVYDLIHMKRIDGHIRPKPMEKQSRLWKGVKKHEIGKNSWRNDKIHQRKEK